MIIEEDKKEDIRLECLKLSLKYVIETNTIKGSGSYLLGDKDLILIAKDFYKFVSDLNKI